MRNYLEVKKINEKYKLNLIHYNNYFGTPEVKKERQTAWMQSEAVQFPSSTLSLPPREKKKGEEKIASEGIGEE